MGDAGGLRTRGGAGGGCERGGARPGRLLRGAEEVGFYTNSSEDSLKGFNQGGTCLS